MEVPLYHFPVHLIYTYVIVYGIVVPYLLKAKYGRFFLLYTLWAIVGLLMNFFYRYYVFLPWRLGHPMPPLSLSTMTEDVYTLFPFVVMNLIALSAVFIKVFKYWFTEQRQKIQFERDKIRAELELLKAQIHPHFLFNTLNNLYALVLEKSDRAPRMLLQLSALLSYVLYECKADEVSLDKEIKLISDYVSLERERYGDRLDISMDFYGDTSNRFIAPLLFQPFIENAFKHGTAEQLGAVWMRIELSVKDDELFFQVVNSAAITGKIKEDGGIGMNNVIRRLSILYPDRHVFQQSRDEETYNISLILALSPKIKSEAFRFPESLIQQTD